MNTTLEKIREAKRAKCKQVAVLGVAVTLKPISAAQGRIIAERHASKQGETAESNDNLLEFWVDCIAASAHDESGLVFDSDEGRELLRELTLDELQDFGSDAALMTGLMREPGDDAKKN